MICECVSVNEPARLDPVMSGSTVLMLLAVIVTQGIKAPKKIIMPVKGAMKRSCVQSV